MKRKDALIIIGFLFLLLGSTIPVINMDGQHFTLFNFIITVIIAMWNYGFWTILNSLLR